MENMLTLPKSRLKNAEPKRGRKGRFHMASGGNVIKLYDTREAVRRKESLSGNETKRARNTPKAPQKHTHGCETRFELRAR